MYIQKNFLGLDYANMSISASDNHDRYTYKFITIASLVAVRKSPVLLIRQGGAEPFLEVSFAISARISYSFLVSSRVCFRRLMNFTATSCPVKIS